MNVNSVARIASLIGEPARSAMLVQLMDGRALTAKELVRAAGVSPATGSRPMACTRGSRGDDLGPSQTAQRVSIAQRAYLRTPTSKLKFRHSKGKFALRFKQSGSVARGHGVQPGS